FPAVSHLLREWLPNDSRALASIESDTIPADVWTSPQTSHCELALPPGKRTWCSATANNKAGDSNPPAMKSCSIGSGSPEVRRAAASHDTAVSNAEYLRRQW